MNTNTQNSRTIPTKRAQQNRLHPPKQIDPHHHGTHSIIVYRDIIHLLLPLSRRLDQLAHLQHKRTSLHLLVSQNLRIRSRAAAPRNPSLNLDQAGMTKLQAQYGRISLCGMEDWRLLVRMFMKRATMEAVDAGRGPWLGRQRRRLRGYGR